MSTLDALAIRRRLGRDEWGVPAPFGPDGWVIDSKQARDRIIVTVGPHGDDTEDWVHASITRDERMPDYNDLVLLHRAVWPNGWAYQCFAPPADHVNIHTGALHLWGRVDGRNCLPNFGSLGTI